MIKLSEILNNDGFLYHVTTEDKIRDIKAHGLIPHKPKSENISAVYLFLNRINAEEAVMNWEQLNDDENLLLLTINPSGLTIEKSDVEYEVISRSVIPPKNIIKIENV